MGEATTLKDAYRYLDPLFFLKKGDLYWDTFYVERENDTLKTLLRSIRNRRHNPCLLYAGHTGCGKSTELERTVHDSSLQQDYIIVHYSIKDELDPANVDYADILISIGAKLFLAATKQGLHPQILSLDKIQEWKDAVIEKSDTLLGNIELKAEGGLNAFFLTLPFLKEGDSQTTHVAIHYVSV